MLLRHKLIAGAPLLLAALACRQRWSIDLKKLGAPGSSPRPISEYINPELSIGIAASNEILVSFVRPNTGAALPKSKDGKIQARLVALLLNPETGTVARQQEWAFEGTLTPKIARLPNGNFVLLLADSVQILDAAFSPIRQKSLGIDLAANHQRYSLSVPASGHYFAVSYHPAPHSPLDVKVFDADTLSIREEWPNLDSRWPTPRLFQNRVISGPGDAPLIKTLGGPWQPLDLSIPHAGAQFLTADRFVALFPNLKYPPQFEGGSHWCWSEIDGRTTLYKPMCYSDTDDPGLIETSADGAVIAARIWRMTAWDWGLDLDPSERVIVYAEGSHRQLLKTSWRRVGIDFALSLDGSMVAVLWGQRLTVYRVPSH